MSTLIEHQAGQHTILASEDCDSWLEILWTLPRVVRHVHPGFHLQFYYMPLLRTLFRTSRKIQVVHCWPQFLVQGRSAWHLCWRDPLRLLSRHSTFSRFWSQNWSQVTPASQVSWMSSLSPIIAGASRPIGSYSLAISESICRLVGSRASNVCLMEVKWSLNGIYLIPNTLMLWLLSSII